MKKYIAFPFSGNNSGIHGLTKVTEWAKGAVAKNNQKMIVCEVVAVVERPEPIVCVKPFTPEPEPEKEESHDLRLSGGSGMA